MKLLMINFLPLAILAAFVVIGLLVHNRKKYFKWIRTHWFFEKTLFSTLGFSMLVLSFLFLLFSLMDVRGPQEQMDIAIPDQKTIVMIDASASMLAEDVKPNRFKRSLFMAKHFVKKAVGHQISLVLFSNIQKRIVPFTDDIDLLNARISGLETLNISRGSSNIAQAIQESLQYFRASAVGEKEISGNILIFSDSEETDTPFDIEIPEKINVAFVGVGTLNGGKIPLRSHNSRFRGYKRHRGKDVVSRLNEKYIKELASKVSHYKYWIASSYSIYTDEIIRFFEKIFLDELESSHQAVIRPVWSHYIAAIGIAFYILSMIFSQFRSFRRLAVVFLLMVAGNIERGGVWAEVPQDLESLKKGELDRVQRLKLAEKFLRKEEKEKALQLYRENVEQLEGFDSSTLLNYGVALFQSGRIEEGMRVYNYLLNEVPLGEKEKTVLQSNIAKALEVQEQKQKQKNKEKSEKGEKGEDSEKQNDSGEQGEQEKKDGEGTSGGNGEQQEGGDKQEEEQKNQNEGEEEQEKKLTGREAFMEKKKNVEKKRKLVKIPEVLKGIMDKERSLQDRAFDTSTHSKKRDRHVKDW